MLLVMKKNLHEFIIKIKKINLKKWEIFYILKTSVMKEYVDDYNYNYNNFC